jgi:nucleotide-binding universal stress UspA family protein
MADLADIVEQRFRAVLPGNQHAGDFHIFGTGEAEELVSLAKSFDLLVFGQASPDYPVAGGFAAEDVVIACGRPLLIVPYAGAFGQIGRRVLIAWDGTREAVRAVHDSLPLLGGAEAVTVVAVATQEAELERWRPNFNRLIRHLGNHGVAATMEETLRSDIAISDLLLSRASDRGADLIVAGAYHHSPTREAWLGGVSRDLLRHMTVPVLMSH